MAGILIEQLNEWKPETIYRLFSGLQAVISGKKLVFSKNGGTFKTEELFRDPKENPRVMKLLEILPKEKAIIFCRYESEISQLCSLLPEAVRFDGTISGKKREAALKDFAGKKRYLIANRNCAGYSLNLQFCHNIIYMSNDWDLGTRLQSEDRVHRIGQSETVSITDIYADGTIDERILRCLHKKEGLLDSIKRDVDSYMDAPIKDVFRKIVRGKEKKEVFDCSDLED